MSIKEMWNNEQEEQENEYGESVKGEELEEGINLSFLQDEPREIETKFGESLAWDCKDSEGDLRTLITSSKRLVKQLKSMSNKYGLQGNKFEIKRSGTGFDTKYEVMKVGDSE